MITCGRCDEPAPIIAYGSNFYIFEKFKQDGQKMAIKTELCNDCHKELELWLFNGGYRDHKGPAFPVRSTVVEIVELRNKLNVLIDKLDTKEGDRL